MEQLTGTEVAEGNTRLPPQKCRNFCFTSYIDIINYNDKMKYLLQGREICPETHRNHIQGFVIFKNPRTIKGIIKEYPGIHWAICKGTIEQNIKYCKKDNNFIEEGIAPSGQGSRTDLYIIAEEIKNKKSIRDIAYDHPNEYIKYNRGINALNEILNDDIRTWEMDVRIYWDEPGTGKTRSVYEEFGFDNVYQKMIGKWWDGYTGQKCILIDDFDPINCFDMTYDFYLKLLDRYPLRVEIKCGTRQITSKCVIFTSNTNPEGWFIEKHTRNAFFRRIKTIKKF